MSARRAARNKRRIVKSFSDLRQAQNKRILAHAKRRWVEDTQKLHALNYWYYRWFTNEFELYILTTLNHGKGNNGN